jgi:anti-sigma-K factor RskA
MEPDRVDQLIAGHALRALSPDDERELEEHLRRSPEVREQLAALQETAASLAFAVESPAPPPSLRDRILADVATEEPEQATVIPFRRRAVVPILGAVAATAAGVAIGLGVWGSSLSSSLDDEQAANARQDEVLALFAEQSSDRFSVSGANGTLVVADGGQAGLVLSGFEEAPADKTYQVWVIEDDTPQPAGLFRGGGSESVVPLTRPVPEGATVAVTVEPAGGVDQPTSDPVLVAPTV